MPPGPPRRGLRLVPGAGGVALWPRRDEGLAAIHLHQGRDAVVGRRVGREQVVRALARQRVDDEHVARGRIALGVVVRNAVRIGLDLAQGAGQRLGVAADLGAATVGLVFAAAADRHLHQGRGDRRQDRQDDRANHAAWPVAAAAEEEGDVGQGRDGAGDGGGDRHGQRVAVLHVGQLVGHDAADLAPVERHQQAARGGHGGVLRIAAGGEGVRLVLVDHIDFRRRQAGAGGQVLDVGGEVADQGLGMALVDRLGPVHGEHDLVGVPVADQVHARAQQEGHGHAGRPPDQIADTHEQGGHGGEQGEGTKVVTHGLRPGVRITGYAPQYGGLSETDEAALA